MSYLQEQHFHHMDRAKRTDSFSAAPVYSLPTLVRHGGAATILAPFVVARLIR